MITGYRNELIGFTTIYQGLPRYKSQSLKYMITFHLEVTKFTIPDKLVERKGELSKPQIYVFRTVHVFYLHLIFELHLFDFQISDNDIITVQHMRVNGNFFLFVSKCMNKDWITKAP